MSAKHRALAATAHRPWPLPAGPWLLSMSWRNLVFLHWRCEPAALQRLLPAGLEVETFDGTAWLGVVPFVMAWTRFRWLPPVPTATRFPELNVRTYVRDPRGKPGVWFFSLDAASRLAVAGARAGFALPYFRARMRCVVAAGEVSYRSERTDGRAPPATFAASWSPAPGTGDVGAAATAAPGSLEHFLVERYVLFASDRKGLLEGEIQHPPWRLRAASVELEDCDMTRLLGLPPPPGAPLAHAAEDQPVVAWAPRRVPRSDGAGH